MVEWLSLRRGIDDLCRRGQVFSFVMRLMFTAICLSLFLQMLALPICRELGLLPFSAGQTIQLGVAMSWLLVGSVAAVIGPVLGREIRSLAIAKAKYEHLSRVDALSGLLNRRAFTEALDETEEGLLAILDLDRFKLINDSHGHGAGDVVIRAIADMLLETAGSQHVVARLGGEEFGIILHGKDHARQMELIETIRRQVAALPVYVEGKRIVTTTSVGVARIAPDRRREAVYAAADRALYQAKSMGRNCLMREEALSEVVRAQVAS
nr:GGDEF domain-containing protein [Allorhizobium sonneratiae]